MSSPLPALPIPAAASGEFAHHPRWNPAQLTDVTEAMVADFFVSPWPAHVHPLRALV